MDMMHSNNETGYTIETSSNPDFTANLITKIVPANTTTFRTGNLAAKTSYYLRVRAINNIGQSAWVNANPFPIVTP
jgi:predicted phage tail protein